MTIRAVSFRIPIHTVSEANSKEHWAVKARRVKHHREVTKACLKSVLPMSFGDERVDCVWVLLLRLGARNLDDDNLRSAFKATRDEIASVFGIDDGKSDRIRFDYEQERVAPVSAGVRCVIAWTATTMTGNQSHTEL